MRALGRRTTVPLPPVLERAGIKLDPNRREVFRDGREVQLAPKEFAVLEVLMRSEGAVVSAEQLLEKAWDENTDPFTNVVRVTVMTLRRKLGEPRHRHRARLRVPDLTDGHDPAPHPRRPPSRPGTPGTPSVRSCARPSGYGSPCCTAGCS